MVLDYPYFMENDDWYYYDGERQCYLLTDKAPEEAVKSYEEYKQAFINVYGRYGKE